MTDPEFSAHTTSPLHTEPHSVPSISNSSPPKPLGPMLAFLDMLVPNRSLLYVFLKLPTLSSAPNECGDAAIGMGEVERAAALSIWSFWNDAEREKEDEGL